MDDMAIIVEKQHLPPAAERHRRPVPWSPRAWRQALFVAAAIPAWLAGSVLFVLILRAYMRPDSSAHHHWPVLLALLPLRAPAPGAHPDPPAPAAGHGRGGDTVAAGREIPLAVPARHRLGGPLAGGVAAGQLSRPRRSRAGRGLDRGGRQLAGRRHVRDPLLLREGAATHDLAPPWLVRGPQCDPPAADTRPPGRYLADAGRRRVAVRRALAYRRRPGARREGSQGAARPEPGGGVGASRRAAGRDPGRGGGRRRRRAPPPRARLARRHPAAAGLPRHQPGNGQSPGHHAPRRRARPSPTPTRRPSQPWPNCGT